MEFTVLGPIGLAADDPVEIGGPRIRRLLAALLLGAGSVVSSDRLLDIVFEGTPTPAAATTLRSYVARLRRVFRDSGCHADIVSVRPGYRIDLRGTTVDADRFETLWETARALVDSHPERAVHDLATALELWSGPAYAGFADEDWARGEAIRLEEMRLSAQEAWFDAMLASGRNAEVVADLVRFVSEHPLRESAQRSAVIALYRDGRQAEALRQGDAYRRELANIGLEPGDSFTDLEHSIAAGDPALLEGRRVHLRGYRIVGRLENGRHGSVQVAVQPGLGRTVAIRSYPPGLADDPLFVRLMEPCVRRVARLEHRHVVSIVDFWREPGAAQLVTQHLRGGTLLDEIAKGPAAVERVGEIVEAVGGALQAAHDLEMSHGVLTPGDILFDETGSPHVDHLEIGRLVDAIAGTSPRHGYARHGVEESGAAADQYALAAIAFHLLTGDLPFAGECNEPFPLVSTTRPELVALDGVLTRAGAIQATDRYPDMASFVRSFMAALGRTSATERPRPPNPYVGLRPFDETDTHRFFGRNDEIQDVLSVLERTGHVVIVGASGSGKSSVVLAGVVPAIRAGRLDGSESWFVTVMRPGADPVAALGAAFDAVGIPRESEPHPDAALLTSTVLVVDQMEELIIRAPDDSSAAFLDELLSLRERGLRLVATLRADVFEQALRHPQLGRLLVDGTLPLLGLDPGDVAAAVTGPAATVGVDVDRELVAQLVAETVHQPTILPLLQYSLTEMYAHGSEPGIDIADYERIGGLAGAVAERAERLHDMTESDALPVLRRVMLRLVDAGSDGALVRRRAPLTDLDELGDEGVVRSVVDRFAAARLIGFDHDPVTREPTIEVAHESLFWSWPRLAAWIDEEGEGISIRAGLSKAAATWDDAGRDTGDLLRGARLASTEEWFAENRSKPTTELERQYLAASIEHRDHRLAEERRVNARLRRRLVAICTVLALAVVAGVIAFVQGRRASDEAVAAIRAQSLALAAASSTVLEEDRSLALLLAIESQRLSRSAPVMRAMLGGLAGSGDLERRVIPTDAADYTALALGPDQRVAVARRGDGSLDVVDLASRSVRHRALPGPARLFGGLSIDRSGTWVASAGIVDDGTAAVVYELGTGIEAARISPDGGAVYWAGFSPDGRSLVVADDLGTVTMYDVGGWDEVKRIETDLEAPIPELAFSHDGSRLYLSEWGPAEGTIGSLWALDVRTGELVAGPVALADDAAISMAVAEDGTVVAGEEHVSFHRGDTLERTFEAVMAAPVSYFGFGFTDDGRLLAADPTELQIVSIGSSDLEVQTIEAPAVGVAPLGDGFIVAQSTGSLATWSEQSNGGLGQPIEPAASGAVTIDPTDRVLAVWGSGRGVELLLRSTLAPLRTLDDIEKDDQVLGLDFSEDGSRIALVVCPAGEGPECAGSVGIWEVDTGRRLAGPVSIGPVVASVRSGVAFARQDQVVVTAGTGMRILDAETLARLQHPLLLSEVSPVASDRAVVVSATDVDGRSRLAATIDTGQTLIAEWRGDGFELLDVIEAVPAMYIDDGTLVTGVANGPFIAREPDTLDPEGPVYRAQGFPNLYRTGGSDMLISMGGAGVELWDRDSGQAMSVVLPAGISAVAPDDRTIYLGSLGDDDAVRALSLEPAALEERACELAGRNLTGAEWSSLMGSDEPYRRTCPRWPDASHVD